MPELSINATTLFYECIGSGPPLLLIHGLGSSGADWAFQREEFSRRHTLILPDLRGSGRSAKPSGPYSIAQFAADLWGLLDALAVESADLLGFSLGGAVAIEMALMRPACVHRLVLCNALSNYRTDTWRKWFEAHAQVALCARSDCAARRGSSPAGCFHTTIRRPSASASSTCSAQMSGAPIWRRSAR